MRHGSTPFAVCAAVVLLSLIPARAPGADEPPLPDSRLGVRTAPLLLLSRPDVRADLGLNSEQTLSAQRTITALYVQSFIEPHLASMADGEWLSDADKAQLDQLKAQSKERRGGRRGFGGSRDNK